MLDRAALPDNPAVRAAIGEARGDDGLIPGAVLPDLEQLTVAAGRIAGDVATLADRACMAFDDTAAQELRAGFRHFGATSAALERLVDVQSMRLDTLSTDLRFGLGRVNESAASLQRTLMRVDSATAGGEIQLAVEDTRLAAAQLRAATAELHTLVQRLGASQTERGRAIARADSVAAKVNGHTGTLDRLVNDPALYTHGDSLLVELRALVADVRANPKRYVSIRLF